MYCLFYIIKIALSKKEKTVPLGKDPDPDVEIDLIKATLKTEKIVPIVPLQIVQMGNDVNSMQASKTVQTIDIEMMEKLLNHIQDFKLLTNEEIEFVRLLSNDDKMKIIMTYNKVVDAIQIMFEDK